MFGRIRLRNTAIKYGLHLPIDLIATAQPAYWVRAGLGVAQGPEQQLAETRLRVALELPGSIAHLRGAMMKLGKIIANYPRLAPEELPSILGYLHFEAPPLRSAAERN